MARLIWNAVGTRLYETGVSHGVLFPMNWDGTYAPGVAWQGITDVDENPSGAEPTSIYADDIKYLVLMSLEEFAASITAYDSPDEFDECDGMVEIAPGVTIGQQTRRSFGFSYRNVIGNDTVGNAYGYKIRIVYGCTASPSDSTHSTINESPEAKEFSWDIATVPVDVPGHKPTATIVIDSTKVSATALAELEDILYGTATEDPRLPLPAEVIAIMGGTIAAG